MEKGEKQNQKGKERGRKVVECGGLSKPKRAYTGTRKGRAERIKTVVREWKLQGENVRPLQFQVMKGSVFGYRNDWLSGSKRPTSLSGVTAAV